jgi:hypothetical protein
MEGMAITKIAIEKFVSAKNRSRIARPFAYRRHEANVNKVIFFESEHVGDILKISLTIPNEENDQYIHQIFQVQDSPLYAVNASSRPLSHGQKREYVHIPTARTWIADRDAFPLSPVSPQGRPPDHE